MSLPLTSILLKKITRFNTRALTLKSLSLLKSKHKPIHPSPVEKNNIFIFCARIGGHPQRRLLKMIFETSKEIQIRKCNNCLFELMNVDRANIIKIFTTYKL